YRQRYEQRSDLSKVTVGQFIETENGARVFFAEEPTQEGQEMGKVVARVIDPEWLSVITAQGARIQTETNGDRSLVLNDGHRYDLQPGQPKLRLIDFDSHGLPRESKSDAGSAEAVRRLAESQSKPRPTMSLLTDNNDKARLLIMWRMALPLAALN